ncbi:alpha/beta hydrolase [Aggregatimonas sangjinii]|uniref:Alpha/beta hydrolase n=1 Tax=Aggregatimonas sangjinii TaxID=2583587 RepID=A0A5B7SVZ7_9FLAO|nr:alpha/beta hydrolase [Aggregatimonas sangjinii]QCX00844.1 alpha/beta hydrolase [Aggregatimonas sangjinii]
MKKFLLVFALFGTLVASAQTLTLTKGKLIDSLIVKDSVPGTFALYLPTTFDTSKEWPIVFVFDMKGRAKQTISMLLQAAETEGYLLAGSNNVNDSLSITKNVLVSSRMMNQVVSMLPIDKNQIYAAGFAGGGRFASVLPTFIKGITGVLSFGGPITNFEVLNSKKPFHFVGIVGNQDYNYLEMLENEKRLNKVKFPNQLYIFDGGAEWPTTAYLQTALQTFTLSALAKGRVAKEQDYVQRAYSNNLLQVNTFLGEQKPFLAQNRITEMVEVFQPHMDLDSLKTSSKLLRKTKLYRTQKRNQATVLFNESFKREDYAYYLEDDILTYNYNNLGWWKYQMEELQEYETDGSIFEQQMGKRLQGYINALIEDNLDILVQEKKVDIEAVNFLWMLKTITQPENSVNYLKVISNSALIEDFETALFYLEELLKNGYSDTKKIYNIEHTALLRITPEFNKVVEKYLKDARYEPIEK